MKSIFDRWSAVTGELEVFQVWKHGSAVSAQHLTLGVTL